MIRCRFAAANVLQPGLELFWAYLLFPGKHTPFLEEECEAMGIRERITRTEQNCRILP